MKGLQGKIWGSTRELEANPFMSFHRADVKAGFRCSRHHHVAKVNGFFVENGRLVVRIFRPSGTEDVTELGAGDYMSVPAGIDHQFECLADTVLFEIYWPSVVSEDIVRKNDGGRL